MTEPRHHASPLRTGRTRFTTDRLLSAGLATAACVGLVGAVGVRGMSDSAATQQDVSVQAGSATLAVSSTGLTEGQLDAYAAQLQGEATKLDAYRAQLLSLAKDLKAVGKQQGRNVTSTPKADSRALTKAAPKPVAKPKPAPKPVAKPKPAPKPVAKAAPKPAKPQSTSKGS